MLVTLVFASLVLLSADGCSGQRVQYLGSKTDRSECRLPADPGPCLAYYTRHYFDTEEESCKMFIYGGCLGNRNNFASFEECQASCQGQQSGKEICSLPKEPGPCRGSFPRYYYDTKSKKCEFFIYGGCRGNANNFSSTKECESTCGLHTNESQGITKRRPKRCFLQKETGPCRGNFPRYHFDKVTKTCDIFIYGGCRGNANNFKTRRGCQITCNA